MDNSFTPKAIASKRRPFASPSWPAGRRTAGHRRARLLVLGTVVAGAGAVATRLVRSARPRPAGWYTVTVRASETELTGPDRPDLLARLAERHEVRIRPAPGGRGSEIAVHAADGGVREQVRVLKQLLETGEVLVVEGQPEGHRTILGRAGGPAFRQLTRRGAR